MKRQVKRLRMENVIWVDFGDGARIQLRRKRLVCEVCLMRRILREMPLDPPPQIRYFGSVPNTSISLMK